MLDKKNGYASIAARKNSDTDRVDHAWCKSLSGLVKHEELRMSCQCPCDGKHLLLPSTEVLGEAAAPRHQVGKEFKRLLDVSPGIGSMRGLRGNPDVLFDRQRAENPTVLRNPGDAARRDEVRRTPVDPVVMERDSPRLGGTTPMIALSVVLFPAPLRPTRHAI